MVYKYNQKSGSQNTHNLTHLEMLLTQQLFLILDQAKILAMFALS